MKAGFVALIGKPNVGKSTLLNALLGQKLSIVSRKAQTTRQRILGILTENEYQIIFIDTPGLIEPTYKLQQEMMKHAESALLDADLIIAMVDPVNTGEQLQEIKEKVLPKVKQKPVFGVLNKCDTIDEEKKSELELLLKSVEGITLTLFISAISGYNLQVLLKAICDFLPEHPPYYSADIVSDKTERFFVAEIIREKIFELLYEEVPYSTAVMVREFNEREVGKTYISADVVVERDSQKKILIGKNGEMLKKIGTLARVDIEQFIGRDVYLELHVAVRKKWRQNDQMLRQFGYVAPTH